MRRDFRASFASWGETFELMVVVDASPERQWMEMLITETDVQKMSSN